MNKIEVQPNAVLPSPYRCYVFCLLGRGHGRDHGSCGGRS